MFVITTDDDGFNRDVACDVARLVRNYESAFLLLWDIRLVSLELWNRVEYSVSDINSIARITYYNNDRLKKWTHVKTCSKENFCFIYYINWFYYINSLFLFTITIFFYISDLCKLYTNVCKLVVCFLYFLFMWSFLERLTI